MEHVRVCILGAGPSGLAMAHRLSKLGCDSLVVLDQESEAGGLCRSAEVDGAPLDIGGGHFLDVRRQEVLDFLFAFMPRSEWLEHERVSRIVVRGSEIDYPIEGNLWQLAVPDQLDFLESIARAGCVNGTPMPEGFVEWIRWKLGDRIAEEYMLPYNRKLFSPYLDELGTYWLYKLPSVSFRETLQSCLERRPLGSLPAHARFLYPKSHGYGEVWRRMGVALGDRLRLDTPLESLDWKGRVLNGSLRYDRLVSTIPWPALAGAAQLPEETVAAITRLKHVSIDVTYVPDSLASRAQWIYRPEDDVAHHRTLLRSNFAPGSRGHWTETNAARSRVSEASFRHRNDFAYPVNTFQKPQAVRAIRDWATRVDILPIGRWGTWEHMNSDVAVAEAIAAADTLHKEL